MAIKVFSKKDFDTGINVVANVRVLLEGIADTETLELVDFVGTLLTDARDCIIYNETSIPDGYNVDYEIREFFGKIHEAVRTKVVDGRVIQNLREVSDSPTWLFEILTSYLLAYTKKDPEVEYLESKKKLIVEWLDEIKTFGYKSEAQRKEEDQKTPQK